MHQLEHGYLKIANTLMDSMTKTDLPANCWRVLFWIMRNSWGYNRKNTMPTTRQKASECMGMSLSSTKWAIGELVRIGAISEKDKEFNINKVFFKISNLGQPIGQNAEILANPLAKKANPLAKKANPLANSYYYLKDNLKNTLKTEGVGDNPAWNTETEPEILIKAYIKIENPKLYQKATQAQAKAVFNQYRRAADSVLQAAGGIDMALRSMMACKAHFDGKGLSWTLHTLARNISDFVNMVI